MKTLHIDRDMAAPRFRGVLAAAAVWLAAGSTLWAQEPGTTWVSQERARIGVLLEEVCQAPPIADAVCDQPPVVTSVVADGPADRAGVMARDTLLTVNGLDVREAEGRSQLLSLEAGVPVALELGREGGRTVIEVTPEVRSTEPYVEVVMENRLPGISFDRCVLTTEKTPVPGAVQPRNSRCRSSAITEIWLS